MEDEIVKWHHWLNGHEFEHALGGGDEQGSLACCSPWGHKELDTTERLNNNNLMCVCVNLQRSPLFLIHPYHGAVSGRTGSTRTCTFLKVKFCI